MPLRQGREAGRLSHKVVEPVLTAPAGAAAARTVRRPVHSGVSSLFTFVVIPGVSNHLEPFSSDGAADPDRYLHLNYFRGSKIMN